MSDKPRLVRRAALALIVVGGLAMVTASGGLVSQSADRGFALNTTSDDSAYLGIEYPEANASRIVELESSDGRFVCDATFFGSCIAGHYVYDDVDLLWISDQTPSGQLAIDSISEVVSGDDIVEDIEYGFAPGYLESARGTFECDPFFVWNGQSEANATITFTIEASSTADSLSIDLDREVGAYCVPD